VIAATALLATLLAQAGGHEQHRSTEPVVRAPGYAALAFDAPAPGSYDLPALGAAADGRVLDAEGRPTSLHSLYDGRYVVLSFIYTSCPDVNGCPLAGFVLRQLQNRLAGDPALAGDVRLISLSFDPATDTPERMRQYGANLRRPGGDWRFVTAASLSELDPILERYDQWVQRDYDAAGNYLGSLSHILRVFLIDRQGRVRNIYSPSYLHADLLYADLKTLQLEEQRRE
jgi:cytochrome oxidase Cu insertion factor (SCO1/SenC/PrrC family)